MAATRVGGWGDILMILHAVVMEAFDSLSHKTGTEYAGVSPGVQGRNYQERNVMM